MKNDTKELYANLYDASFPGLEYEFIRLCERFKASFGFDFGEKDLDRILTEFAEKQLPPSMQNTVNALRFRRELWRAAAHADELTYYAETLQKDLDEYADGQETHVVEMLYSETRVRVQISIYAPGKTPRKTVCLQQDAAMDAECEYPIQERGGSLVFVRDNNRFKFSPAFAQKDANDLIGFILQNSKVTAEQIAEQLKFKGYEKVQSELKTD